MVARAGTTLPASNTLFCAPLPEGPKVLVSDLCFDFRIFVVGLDAGSSPA